MSRDWRLSASRAITCLAPADLQLDKLAAAFPLLHELDLSGCMQVCACGGVGWLACSRNGV